MTNMHGHLIVDLRGPSGHDPLYEDFTLTDAEMAPELDEFAANGGFALVELTPRGLGRDSEWIREAAARTGVHIVAGAGLYHDRFHPASIARASDDELTDWFVEEVEVGLDGTNVRAGIIGEIGSNDDRLTTAEERVFRAAARAGLRTGAAVSTHTHLGRLADEQLDTLMDEGLGPDRIVIGHLDDVAHIDLDLCSRIAARGAYVQFDGAGCEYYSETIGSQLATDVERLEAVSALADAGFASRVLLASDVCRKRHLVARGGPGLRHFSGPFTALAVDLLGAELAQTVLIDNPRNVLSLERPTGGH
ncbi:phosphotriesterase-related protein [Microbacterium ulmi]|nr:phosphotriesterase-related protein [Microbacterium ulmi]